MQTVRDSSRFETTLRRRLATVVMKGLAIFATIASLAILASLLGYVLYHGVHGMSLTIFTESTKPTGADGGLLNAIVGSLMITLGACIVGIPLGLLAGVYLVEYAPFEQVRVVREYAPPVLRFVSDMLASKPSIIAGLFVYEIMVLTTGGFSAFAGAVSLATIMLPVVMRTTDVSLGRVSVEMRLASAALGAPTSHTVWHVVFPAARTGILAGILLALARICGETAPLMFTSLNDQFWSIDPTQPIASLPVVIYQYAMSPYADWHDQAWAGVLLITAFVLLLSILGQIGEKKASAMR